MLNRKVAHYATIFIIVTACTKQGVISIVSTGTETTSNTLSGYQKIRSETTFGLFEEMSTIDHTKKRMDRADIDLVRVPIFLSKTTVSKTIDDYLNSGYNVQINANWYNDTNGKRTFPKDTNLLKSQAKAFFKYYEAYKNKISFVAIENEWDYEVMCGSNLQDYLVELSILTSIGHKHGFKIADGGITSSALQRWTYSQLSGDAQIQWRKNYYVGLNNNYDVLMHLVNTYIKGVKKINIDYSNVHWYNTMKCGNGFLTASENFRIACRKKLVVCNEFGIRTSSFNLFDSTADEMRNNVEYAIAYSGTNSEGKAIKLTNDMLDILY